MKRHPRCVYEYHPRADLACLFCDRLFTVEYGAIAQEREACLEDLKYAMTTLAKWDGFGNPIPPLPTAAEVINCAVARIGARGKV